MFIERRRRSLSSDNELDSSKGSKGRSSHYDDDHHHPYYQKTNNNNNKQLRMMIQQQQQQQQFVPKQIIHSCPIYVSLCFILLSVLVFSTNNSSNNNNVVVVEAFTTLSNPFGGVNRIQQQQQKQSNFPTSSRLTSTKLSLSSSTTTTTTIVDNERGSNMQQQQQQQSNSTTTTSTWFPTRIQESIDYDIAVERLYVRHIVTQTKEMANLIVQQYVSNDNNNELLLLSNKNNNNNTSATTSSSSNNNNKNNKNEDKFGQIAKLISDCTYTRMEGGKIGWIERTDELQNIVSNYVIQQLYQFKPKSGDIYIIANGDPQQYHVIQVTEVWLNPNYVILGNNGNIRRKRNKKFKGYGVVPQVPNTFQTYLIQTSGCQMNVADSERLEGILQKELHLQPLLNNINNNENENDESNDITTNKKTGKDNNNNKNTPDLILFNTCSIRDHAEQKLYNAIGPFAAQRRKKNSQQQSTLIVTGCVAQQEGEKLIQRIPEIDAVIGPQYIPYLANIIDHIRTGGNQLVLTAPLLIQQENYNYNTGYGSTTNSIDTNNNIDEVVDNGLYTKPVRGHDVRAWVNVIHGCNEHCTYCVVPATRGMEQSRSMEAIYDECQQLAADGYKEITLLGQNIDAYGRDMVPKRTFAQLLQYLNTNLVDSSIERIRYVTSHPRYFSDRVIEAVANLDKVCECFHMPFQAGDDTVLRRMRRGYTYDSYMKIIERIRDIASNDAAITTDIIVGFPGETEQQFQRTLDLMEDVKFDNVNSFIYSPRPNTEAATYEDIIPYEIKAERLQRVQQLAAQHGQERSNRYLHRVVEVLVEDTNPKNPLKQIMGRTRQGRQVYFDGNLSELKGQLVQVLITEARTWSLLGKLVL